MNPKKAVTVALLLFVAYSLVLLATKRLVGDSNDPAGTQTPENVAKPVAADRVIVYYFHGRERCENCRNLEAFAREAVEREFADQLANGRIEWQVVDFSRAENAHFDRDYKLGGVSCVALSEVRDGAEVRHRVLDDGLMLVITGTKQEVIDYVTSAIHDFIENRSEEE